MATREILPHGLERERDLLLLIDSVTDYAIFLLDPGGHVVTWNAGAEHIHGYSAGEILGSHLSRFYPAEDVAAGKPERELVDAARVGRVEDEGWRLRKDGSRFWANVVVIALRGRGGELHGFGKVTRDLTERREADATQRELERQQVGRALAEDAAARERLLAQATSALGESLDYEATLGRLAGIVVPGLADWCAVHLLEGGTLVSLTIAHADPAKAALARKVDTRWGARLDDTSGVARVLRTGARVLASEITDEMVAAAARDPEHLQALRGLGIRSAVIAPMKTHGPPFGALSFVSAESGRRYDERDAALFEELARRAAFAVENARAYREARGAVRLRDEFLSIAGHELRTPLSALELQLQSLERSFSGKTAPIDAACAAERLRRAVGQAKRLEHLVDELLDVSRITAGRLALQVEEFDLAALVDEVVERLDGQALRPGGEIHVHHEGDTRGAWDRGRVDQIVSNLVGNAVKYGERRPVDVEVAGRGASVVLTVRDRGIGIEASDQERIFGRFERAVSQRAYGGLGIGLWVVRELATAHGGTVRVESSPGAGSTFVVDLPRTAVPAAQTVTTQAPPSPTR